MQPPSTLPQIFDPCCYLRFSLGLQTRFPAEHQNPVSICSIALTFRQQHFTLRSILNLKFQGFIVFFYLLRISFYFVASCLIFLHLCLFWGKAVCLFFIFPALFISFFSFSPSLSFFLSLSYFLFHFNSEISRFYCLFSLLNRFHISSSSCLLFLHLCLFWGKAVCLFFIFPALFISFFSFSPSLSFFLPLSIFPLSYWCICLYLHSSSASTSLCILFFLTSFISFFPNHSLPLIFCLCFYISALICLILALCSYILISLSFCKFNTLFIHISSPISLSLS